MESCEWLHWHNSRMPFMQLLQNSFSQRTRNYNTNSPQQTTVFYGEFIPSLIPRLNNRIFVIGPSFHCILNDSGQHRIACFSAERYSILYWYADSKIAHPCSLAAARVGIPLFGPSNVTKGLWSVTNKNLRPYRYWWNLLIPKIILRASFSICA